MRLIYLLSSFILMSLNSNGQGIEFFHGTWQEAIKEAQTQEKIIFVDAYTTWCGPCKRMSKNVFTKEKAGNYFNSNFINLKIDMEKPNGREFGAKYPVSAYPTLFFLDSNGKLIKKSVGGKNLEALILLGEEIVSKYDFSAKYKEAYEDGDRSFETVMAYVEALNKSNKSSVKVANEFLRENKDLKRRQRNEFLFKAASEVDSRIFDQMIDNKFDIIRAFGASEFQEKVLMAADNTVKKAIQFDDEDLFNLAIKTVKKHCKSSSKVFTAEAKMQLAISKDNSEDYLKGSKQFLKEKGNINIKMDWASKAQTLFPKDESVQAMVYSQVVKDLADSKDKNHITSFCKLCVEMGKYKEALAYAKAAELRVEDQSTKNQIKNLITYIERTSK